MTDIYADDRNGGGSEVLRSLGIVPIPDIHRVTAVAVVPIDAGSGKVLVVQLKDRGLDIPGGHRQREDAGLEATARRECLEEACVELGDLRLLDVIESEHYGSTPDQLTYMVIYSAVINRTLPFSATPESLDREFVEPPAFLERYTGGDDEMMRRWVEAATKEFRGRTQ